MAFFALHLSPFPLPTLHTHEHTISPIKFLSASPFRFIYCLIMGAWGGDVLQNMLDKGLYFHSDGGLEDAFDFFGNLYRICSFHWVPYIGNCY